MLVMAHHNEDQEAECSPHKRTPPVVRELDTVRVSPLGAHRSALCLCLLAVLLTQSCCYERLPIGALRWPDGSAATAPQPQQARVDDSTESFMEHEEENLDNAFGGDDVEIDPQILEEIASEHLYRGNMLSFEGRHEDAIAEWTIAAEYKPDSNVPWNNMANSYTALGNLTAARDSAEQSYKRGIDHMSATTLGNIYKALKMFEEAEQVLIKGCQSTIENGRRYEHAFWTLAMLYHMQGDYIEFLKYGKLGLEHLSRGDCAPGTEQECITGFENDVVESMYKASMELGKHSACHKHYDIAEEHLDWAADLAERYPSEALDSTAPGWHKWCVSCARAEAAGDGGGSCGVALSKCKEIWCDTNGRYLRMMAVRIMGCDWRTRAEDESDFARMAASPRMEALLNHTIEFYFECDQGLVCGAGAQPPLHMWGMPMTLDAVLVMGKIQPLQLMDKVALGGPAPVMAFPTWSPTLGANFRIGYISSDLLRDHPVGNMMRSVLQLHDLSKMDVTLFIIHDHQKYAVSYPENRHVIGDVKIKMIGRGPHVINHWDERESVQAADVVNADGICILFDLIGYTSDHRQDVMSLRPAPIQVHYHGYMGSTGAPWIDSYVADRFIAPPEHTPYFSEKLAFMPECFLGPSHRLVHQFWGGAGGSNVEEQRAPPDDHAERRRKEGLSEDGPLLCYFNQHFKIDPETFKVWMDALQAVNHTSPTFWMLAGSPVSHRNLWREFEAAGLPRDRLVFAKRIKVKQHLRRASLCDVAVDTPEYNSGATAADTLYAGIPIVHFPGNKAVGRMLSAMLNAVRLPQLIVRDRADYRKLLIELLGESARRKKDGRRSKADKLKSMLRKGVLWEPLYDVARWVADFETLCRIMWDTHVAGYPVMHNVPRRPLHLF